MRWPLIVALSAFGFAMGIATVSVISPTVEPLLWLGIFIICAFLIARFARRRLFLHGLALGIVNSVWVTGAHVLFFGTYMANHPREAAMSASMPLAAHPRVMMALVGPIVGVVSGIVIGVLTLVAARLVGQASRKEPTAAPGGAVR